MANAQKKKKPMRSRKSGLKTSEIIKHNQQVINNVWKTINNQQVLKNF